MAVESYSIHELTELIKEGSKYRLFKPFFFKGQVLINVEKILTEKDLFKLEGKQFGPIQVVSAVEHNTDDKVRKSIIDFAINILKTSKLFKVDDVHHLDWEKKKECEKLLTGIISESPHLANLLIKLYKHSKKLFVHSITVGMISTIIDLGIQEKNKIHDGLRSEELLTAALLHDIGFLKLPLAMAEKRRIEYNEEELKLYKKYPEEGRSIVHAMGDNFRQKTLEIIHQHREKLTGDGFPQKLSGSKVMEESLIVGVADEFDLIVTNEISSSERPPSEILSRISRMGKMYGPKVVDSFYTWFRYLK
jgi:response regulator RpfG family c-di-GMP phosphodiesterase